MHMVNWAKRINQLTGALRNSTHPLDVRLREVLAEKGIDPQQCVVANMMQEDPCVESGFLVSDDGRVYEFELYYRDRPLQAATLRVWRDVTHTYQTRAFGPAIAVALTMLQRGHVQDQALAR